MEPKIITKAVSAAVLFVCSMAALAKAAEQAAPSPMPVPSPAASAPADPCGTILSIVNRPVVTNTACTVRPHQFEVESGWNNTITTGQGSSNLGSYGVGAIRFGTGDPHFEFSISPPIDNRAPSGTITNGLSDSGFGVRDELGYSANALWGVNAAVTLPTGARAFSAGGTQFTGNFNWSYTVNPVLGLAGTLGFNQLRAYNTAGVSQPYFAFVPTLEGTASLPGPSELYAEYAYYSQTGITAGSKSLLDFGYSHVFGPHLLFDVEYGESPTMLQGQRQHYIGAGLSFMS